jgi:hypothetical protein
MEMVYVDDLVVHHHPHSAGRAPDRRRRLTLRNRPWVLRERRPVDRRVEALLDALPHPPV